MGLPVTALSDDELIHYAGIDEDAQKEMARRSIEYRGTYLSEVTDLKKEVEELREQIEELEGESSAADDLQECIQRVYDLLKDFKTMDTGEAFEAIQSALDEISDFAR
jgi:predicted nuclease with TOPRIM domain